MPPPSYPAPNSAAQAALRTLTPAADRLPYFTSPTAAAVATFTAAGRALIDDADAAAQRTTLGLGTSAVVDTGTNGTKVPLLDGANTWSGAQTIALSVASAVPLILTEVEAAAAAGPYLFLFRDSASPAANDGLGAVRYQGRDSNNNSTAYITVFGQIDDATDGSEDSSLWFQHLVAGAASNEAVIGGGVIVGNPTGGRKGTGTLNATAVYDDNVLLTCPALQAEFLEKGTIDLAKWDALVPGIVIPAIVTPARVERRPVLMDAQVAKIEEQPDGKLVQVVTTEQVEAAELRDVHDESGRVIGQVKVALFEDVEIPEEVVPEQRIVRQHTTAHLFADMLGEGFDPRSPQSYRERLLKDSALPGMPTEATWQHNTLGSGEILCRLWLASEFMALQLMDLQDRVTALEAR